MFIFILDLRNIVVHFCLVTVFLLCISFKNQKNFLASFAVQPCPPPYPTLLHPQSSPGADCDNNKQKMIQFHPRKVQKIHKIPVFVVCHTICVFFWVRRFSTLQDHRTSYAVNTFSTTVALFCFKNTSENFSTTKVANVQN